MDDIEQTTVIDPPRWDAWPRAERTGGARPYTAGTTRAPERPVEPSIAALMTAFAALWLAGMLTAVWLMLMSAPAPWAREAVSAVCVAAAVCAPVPAWAYLACHVKEGRP